MRTDRVRWPFVAVLLAAVMLLCASVLADKAVYRGVLVDLADGSSQPVAASHRGKIIYRDSAGQFQQSTNQGGFIPFGGAAVTANFPATSFGTPSLNIAGGISSSLAFLQINPNDSFNTPWSCAFSQGNNSPAPGDDSQVGCGWNKAGTPGADATKGSMTWNMESDCNTGTGCPSWSEQMEWYNTFTPPSGLGLSAFRWLTANGRVGDGNLSVALVGSQVSIGYGHSINDPIQFFASATQTNLQSQDGVLAITLANTGTIRMVGGPGQSGSAQAEVTNTDVELRVPLHNINPANEQTTVGASGAASNTPAAPQKYLKVIANDGVTYVIPLYKAQ